MKPKKLHGLFKAEILLKWLNKNSRKKVLSFLTTKEINQLKNSPYSTKPNLSDEKKVHSELKQYMKENPPTSLSSDLTLILILLLILISLITLYLSNTQNPYLQIFLHFIETGGIFFLLYPFFSYIANAYYKTGLPQSIFKSNNRLQDTFLALITGIILGILMVSSQILANPPPPLKIEGFYLIILIIAAAGLGPIIEEFFFRKIIYSYFRSKSNIIIGLIASSFLFSLAHLRFSGVEFLFYFIAGALLVTLYEKSGNLYAPFIAHSTGNIITLIYN